MAVTLNASTSSGLVQTADTSGTIELQSNGTTRLTVNSSGATIPTATVTTLNTPTGVLATQNGMTGIPKAWLNYNGSTQTINSSFNVSSVTRNGLGDFTVNFSTAMPNANYAQSLTISGAYAVGWPTPSINANSSSLSEVAPTTTTARFACWNSSGAYYDPKYVCFIAISS